MIQERRALGEWTLEYQMIVAATVMESVVVVVLWGVQWGALTMDALLMRTDYANGDGLKKPGCLVISWRMFIAQITM
jgi:hypothetical protein